MNLGGCNCCEEPPIDAPELEIIGVSASCETACAAGAITTNFSGGKIKTETYSIDPENLTGPCDYESEFSGGYVRTSSTVATGSEPGDCSGSSTIVLTVTFLANGAESRVWSGSGSFSRGVDEDSETASFTINADGSVDYGGGPEFTCFGGVTTITYVPDPEIETTIDSTRTAAACVLEFPEYPDFLGTDEPVTLLPGQSTSAAGALRNWSEAEEPTPGNPYVTAAEGASKDETKIKWRMKHLPPITCYLKVWLEKTFTPAGMPAETPVEVTYEWIGTGNPCLNDPALPVNDPNNYIFGDATEILPPATNGLTVIEILKFSCVQGYEPDISDTENPQPNGFPDPLWEAAPP